MCGKYTPYEVRKGKEYSVKEENGQVYCGEYLEDLMLDQEEIGVGLYNDPIRGEDEVATITLESLRYGLCITGNTGYGKSTLMRNIFDQIKDRTTVISFDYKGDAAEDSYDRVIKDIDPDFIFENCSDNEQARITVEQLALLFGWSVRRGDGEEEDIKSVMNASEEKLRNNEISSLEDFASLVRELKSEVEESTIRDFKDILASAKEIFGSGDMLDWDKIINNNENILIKLSSEKEIRSTILTKMVIQELYKYEFSNPVITMIDNADVVLDGSWGNLIATSRSNNIGFVFSFQNMEQLDPGAKNHLLNNISNWILFNQPDVSTAQKLAQILNMSGQELKELEEYEAYLKPITPRGNKADINVKTEVFPPLRPESR